MTGYTQRNKSKNIRFLIRKQNKTNYKYKPNTASNMFKELEERTTNSRFNASKKYFKKMKAKTKTFLHMRTKFITNKPGVQNMLKTFRQKLGMVSGIPLLNL